MINKCKICGKEFEAKQRNHNICSEECRKINRKNLGRLHYDKDISRLRNAIYREKHRKIVNCKICGKLVEPHVTATGYHAYYHYHRGCLIDAAIAAMLRGEKFNKSEKNILMVAANKGFQKADLLEIMAERGIKYGKQKPFAVWRG